MSFTYNNDVNLSIILLLNDQWTPIVVGSEIYNKQLLDWVNSHIYYHSFVRWRIKNLLCIIEIIHNKTKKIINSIVLFKFIYLHHYTIKHNDDWKIYINVAIEKLNDFKDNQAPLYQDIWKLFIDTLID